MHLTGKEPMIAKLAAIVGYTGKKFQLKTVETVDATYNAHWSGGSRSYYTFIDLATMRSIATPEVSAFTGNAPALERIPLRPGLVCVEHCHSCGKDMGLRIYVSPDGLNPGMLPAATAGELTRDDKIVLYATRAFKSSYNGIKDHRFYCANRETGITRDRWEAAKNSLIERKLLNKAGAITTDGRNAVDGMRAFPVA